MADQAIYAPYVVLDANGDPVPGALATFYATGTLTIIDIYEDAAETILAENPVEADANGVLPQRFFNGQAKVVITTADAETLHTIDPVAKSLGDIGGAAQVSYAPTALVPVDTVQDAIDLLATQIDDMDGDFQPLDGALTSLSGLSLAQGDLLYATAADTLARLPKGTAGQTLRMNAGATAPVWSAIQAGVVVAQYTSGTDGSAFPTGSFAALQLNTELHDTIGMSVGSNQITLNNAGTYLFMAKSVAYNGSAGGRQAQVRLYNVTTTTALGVGQVTNSAAATPMTLECTLVLTLEANTVLEFQGIASGSTVLQCDAGSFGTEIGNIVTILRLG